MFVITLIVGEKWNVGADRKELKQLRIFYCLPKCLYWYERLELQWIVGGWMETQVCAEIKVNDLGGLLE